MVLSRPTSTGMSAEVEDRNLIGALSKSRRTATLFAHPRPVPKECHTISRFTRSTDVPW